MNLVDLHRHLDGSLRPATLAELAAPLGVTIPPDLAFAPGMGLDQALARFAVTLAVLQQPAAVRRVAREICEDAAAEGVTVLELRFAPQLHQGAPIAAIVDAALEGAAGRAGIILCGLYGEPPELVERLVAVARTRPGVVGLDLAGGPAPGHRWEMRDYYPAFARARDLGLGCTVHAGEGRPAAEIRVAIEELGARRIGHGTTLADDPAVLELALRRSVTVEACLTSNLHTGVIPSIAAHPLRRWLDAGVAVTLCTDNTLLSQTSSQEELRRAATIPGITPEDLERTQVYGRAARFIRGF